MALASHPATVLMGFYSEDLAIQTTVEPYMVSILALNEVSNNRHLSEVKKFILWYFSRLNYPDKFGLTGTIYVYDLVDGVERSAYKYDSVDGYAGLFLHLLHQYVIKTGDIELLQTNWGKIADIAYLIPALQDSDGLTFAVPESGIKYLMDNCEAYGGLSAYIEMEKLVGKEGSTYYSRVRSSIKNGVFTYLYDAKGLTFAWAIENNYKSLSSWKRYYPDAYAQLFPIYFDLLVDKPEVKAHIWLNFSRNFAGEMGKYPLEQRIIYELTKKKMGGRRTND